MGSRTFYGLLGALIGLAIVVAFVGVASSTLLKTREPVSAAVLAQQTATAAAGVVTSTLAPPSLDESPTLLPVSSSSLLLPHEALQWLGSHTMTTVMTYSGPVTETVLSTMCQADDSDALRRILVSVNETSLQGQTASEVETIYAESTAYQRRDGSTWSTYSPAQLELDAYATDWLGGYGTELLACPLTLKGHSNVQGLAVEEYIVSVDCLRALEPGAILDTCQAELSVTENERLIIYAHVYLKGTTDEGESFTYELTADISDIGDTPDIVLPDTSNTP